MPNVLNEHYQQRLDSLRPGFRNFAELLEGRALLQYLPLDLHLKKGRRKTLPNQENNNYEISIILDIPQYDEDLFKQYQATLVLNKLIRGEVAPSFVARKISLQHNDDAELMIEVLAVKFEMKHLDSLNTHSIVSKLNSYSLENIDSELEKYQQPEIFRELTKSLNPGFSR